MKVLLTGAAGFVGSHVVRHLLTNTNWDIVAPVSFRHKGLAARIESSICDLPEADRLDIVHWDMRSPADGVTLSKFEHSDVIMNIASESHVDRSIAYPADFIANNVALMTNILDVAREITPRLFLQMSTDEVYGPADGEYRHREWDTIKPSNPYSASKACQEAIAFSYWRTFDVPVVVTNTMNIIGEMQDPEKFLPMIIRNLRDGKPVTVHCDEYGISGSRFYLHARNLADAWVFLTETHAPEHGDPVAARYSDGFEQPDRFHIVGEQEIRNDELVAMVAEIMGTTAEIDRVSFHASRPGHDLRYALDGQKLADEGWEPPVPFYDSLEKTVNWYLTHPTWLGL